MTRQLGLLADQIAFERRVSMAQLVMVLLLFVFVALSRGTLSILSPILEAQARERKRRESASEPPRHALSPPKTKEDAKRADNKEPAIPVDVKTIHDDNEVEEDTALFAVVPSPSLSSSAPPSRAATLPPLLPFPSGAVVPDSNDAISVSSSVRHSPRGDLCHTGDASVYRENPPESPRRRWSDALSPDLYFLPSIRRRKSSGDA